MNLLIINANEVITMASDVKGPRTKEAMKAIGVRKNVSVLLADRRIVDIAPLETLHLAYPQLIEKAEVIDASGKVVMPGLVDCHTHLVHGGTREDEFQMRLEGKTYMEIMNAGGGIYNTTNKTRAASFEHLYAKAYLRLNDFL